MYRSLVEKNISSYHIVYSFAWTQWTEQWTSTRLARSFVLTTVSSIPPLYHVYIYLYIIRVCQCHSCIGLFQQYSCSQLQARASHTVNCSIASTEVNVLLTESSFYGLNKGQYLTVHPRTNLARSLSEQLLYTIWVQKLRLVQLYREKGGSELLFFSSLNTYSENIETCPYINTETIIFE